MRNACLSLIALISLALPTVAGAEAELIARQALIEDTRLLFNTIESVHPDPYVRGGGKIAFHRRVHHVLESIPADGMSPADYHRLLEPAVAAIGDGHTAVSHQYSGDPYAPGGIPLYFETAAEGLFVAAVLRDDHRDLLGALLLSIEGVPFDALVARYARVRGADNKYLLYRSLGTQGVLWKRHSLQALVPEWTGVGSIRLGFMLADGSRVERVIDIPDTIDYAAFIMPPSERQQLIAEFMTALARSDFFYFFLDPGRETCLLVIHDLSTYREAFEAWQSFGITSRDTQARALCQRYHGTAPPEDPAAVIQALPSATELFRAMAEEMRAAGTKNLLIDLSQNGGGSSLMSNILVYFLYGKERLIDIKGRSNEIVKYSPEYFEMFPKPSLEEINRTRTVPLTGADYDLNADHAFNGYPGREYVSGELDNVIAWMPTFEEEYASGRYSAFYRPEQVLVLCDAGTFSAAFWVMYYLKQCGAAVAGIPSAQAGNCFGDIMQFTLPRSGLQYQVSRKYFELFPGDPDRGTVLMPDHVLTWKKLASYNFDPAALVRFAEDILAE